MLRSECRSAQQRAWPILAGDAIRMRRQRSADEEALVATSDDEEIQPEWAYLMRDR